MVGGRCGRREGGRREGVWVCWRVLVGGGSVGGVPAVMWWWGAFGGVHVVVGWWWVKEGASHGVWRTAQHHKQNTRIPAPLASCPARSMEGATLSGRQCAYKVLEDAEQLAAGAAAKQQQQAVAV